MTDNPSVTLPLRPADNGGRAAHSGAGPMNVNTGSGVQKNYNQSGGSGNRQFNAEIIYYTERGEPRPDYTGTYSYTSLQPVASYVARPALQAQMEERLRDARVAESARTTILVLVGLGGAGKSQLVLNYIQKHRKEYSAVFWIDARLRESVERDFIQIYILLFGHEQNLASLQADVDRVVTEVKAWFHSRDGRWLIVFDNADSLDDETDPYFVNLRRYLPDAPGIEIILTSRSQTAADMTELEAVEVGKLLAGEAIDIFLRCSKLRNPASDVLDEVKRIVHELDYLALAVTLAGAFVAATPRIRSNIHEYLPEYQQRRKTLLSRKAKQLVHHYGESVLSTWETSYAAIAKQCPTAVRLLSFFAFLDAGDIFLELFRPKPDSLITASESQADDWRAFFSADAPFEEVLDEALEALSTYSLVQWKDEQGAYSMHKLVHAWGFDRLDAEEQGEYSASSLAFLTWVVQDRRLDPDGKIRVAPHISSSVARLREWRRTSLLVSEPSLRSIRSLADFLNDAGQYRAELELRSLEQVERGLLREKDEAAWLHSLSDLAAVLWRQGRYEEAEEINRRALEGSEKMSGKDHPNSLVSMSNLALVLQDQGKYEASEEMTRRALEGREKVLGMEHHDTLTSLGNLALVLKKQGKYEAAEEINRRALEGYEKVLGEEHPLTLISMTNLATVLQSQEKLEAAAETNRRALKGYEKVLGEQHPSTLTSISNLATVLLQQGKHEEAAEMYERALKGYEKVLGEEHHSTLLCVYNFATLQYQKADYAMAIKLYERAHSGYSKTLGPSHPTTLECSHHVSYLRNHVSKMESENLTTSPGKSTAK